jgi:hypothetical protein
MGDYSIRVGEPYGVVVDRVRHLLESRQLRVSATGNMQGRDMLEDCHCPHHGTDQCDCQYLVIMVDGAPVGLPAPPALRTAQAYTPPACTPTAVKDGCAGHGTLARWPACTGTGGRAGATGDGTAPVGGQAGWLRLIAVHGHGDQTWLRLLRGDIVPAEQRESYRIFETMVIDALAEAILPPEPVGDSIAGDVAVATDAVPADARR